MYRDDPLDDEAELIDLLGEAPVRTLRDGAEETGRDALGAALDVLRVLQGWVDDAAAARWFLTDQRRLEDRSPLAALADGDVEDVEDAARAWAAANA